jgi:hypothetical protein
MHQDDLQHDNKGCGFSSRPVPRGCRSVDRIVSSGIFFSLDLTQPLKFLVVRVYQPYLPLHGSTCRAYGSEFTPTSSSLNRKSSPTWRYATTRQTTHPMGSPILGRDFTVDSLYASRRCVHRSRSASGKSRKYAALFFYQRRTECASCQTYRREINGDAPISHPNIIPIIEVSKVRFPFCIMSPWMSDGNISQYTKTNPEVNRLALVRAHPSDDR